MEKTVKKEELLRMTECFELAGQDSPFAQDEEMTVFRRKDNRKWFGIYFRVPRRIFGEGEGSEYAVDLKCVPALSRMLFETYGGVVPAYHMNKVYWITVRLDGSVPREEIEKLLRLSYDLVAPKVRPGVKKK